MRVASLAWLSRCSRREALAERVLRTPPLPGSPWDVLPNDIGQLARDDFPNLWRTRQEQFGRGGRGAAPILRSQFVANESAAARARGKAAREREKTKEATARAEKWSKRFAESQDALYKSQTETDAANERIAGLVDQLRRERRESERSAHLKRSEELGRRSVETRAREAEARARAADRNKSEAERERDRLRADLDKLKAADDERRANDAKTRAEATTLLGEVEADDDDAFHRSVEAFRSAVDHGLDALGAEDKQSIWDGIYRPLDVARDTLVENVMAGLSPAASKERTPTGAVKEWTKPQMERRPVRVNFTDRGAAQRSGKSKGAVKEAGIDDGGLTNEMYANYFDQVLLLLPHLFASTGAIGARALPTKDADRAIDAINIYEGVGRVMCRAVLDGRPIPKALASTIVVRFLQGVEPAALNASGAMVRGPFSKTELLDELLLIDDPRISGLCQYIVGEDDMSEMFDTVGTALCWSKNGQWSAADPDAQILALPWSNEPADRILVAERLFQREIIEPRRKALEAMRRGFRTVEMVPQLTRALFPSSRQLSRFISGDDELSAESLWSLFTFDPEAYSQTLIEYDHTSDGIYTEDEPTMRHLRDVLSEFCDADRLKFFKFVTGLTAIPVTRPGAAKPLQLLIDGKTWPTDRLPQAAACYYQLHCPPYPTKDMLMDKLRTAIHETEGFDQK